MALHRYRFRGFLLDPAARELWSGDTLVALPASSLDALIHLIEHRDRAVGRDELIAAVWGRADVADNLLAQTILKVRRALGDTGSEGAIRTIARFGYRWVETTRIEEGDLSDALVARDPPASDGVAGYREDESPGSRDPASQNSRADAVDTITEHAARESRRPTALALAFALVTLMGLAWIAVRLFATDPEDPPGSVADSAIATDIQTQVLPARIPDLPGWEWLRLGLMDVIGNRLRLGGLPVTRSEQVLVELAASDAPPGTDTAVRQVQPQADYRDGQWRVVLRLTAHDGRIREVAAEATEVLDATRAASDQLLVLLGHAPPSQHTTQRSLALEELMQRTRTAILTDQFDLARSLIAQAPEALQDEPEVKLRLAQIDQGRGDDLHAVEQLETLLLQLPDGLDPSVHGRILTTLGSSQFRLGNMAVAMSVYSAAIEQLAQARDPIALAAAYGSRAAIALHNEDFPAATADLGRARVEMAAGGDALGLAQIDTSLGLAQILDYRPALGLPVLRAAEERIATLGAREELAQVRYAQVGAQLQLLDHQAALATVARFWPPQAHTGNQRLRWRLVLAHALARLATGELKQASSLLDEIRLHATPEEDAGVLTRAAAITLLVQAAAGGDGAVSERAGTLLDADLEAEQADLYLTVWMTRLRSLRAQDRLDEARSGTVALRTWVEARSNRWRDLQADLADAEQAWADNELTQALKGFANAFEQARQLAVPEDLASVVEIYVQALIAAGELDRAASVIGTVAGWAEQDARIAWAQALVYRAQSRIEPWQRATEHALQLAHERPLPFVRLRPPA